ncbi:hypothetical protein DEI86_00620 [Curtobacterium sp. MCBD17_028]|nr:hypothetical protein DEI86_00620 [Curtobacterium sp. MCBD17_028]
MRPSDRARHRRGDHRRGHAIGPAVDVGARLVERAQHAVDFGQTRVRPLPHDAARHEQAVHTGRRAVATSRRRGTHHGTLRAGTGQVRRTPGCAGGRLGDDDRPRAVHEHVRRAYRAERQEDRRAARHGGAHGEADERQPERHRDTDRESAEHVERDRQRETLHLTDERHREAVRTGRQRGDADEVAVPVNTSRCHPSEEASSRVHVDARDPGAGPPLVVQHDRLGDVRTPVRFGTVAPSTVDARGTPVGSPGDPDLRWRDPAVPSPVPSAQPSVHAP